MIRHYLLQLKYCLGPRNLPDWWDYHLYIGVCFFYVHDFCYKTIPKALLLPLKCTLKLTVVL